MNNNKVSLDGHTKGQIDWVITLVPLVIIIFLAVLFFVFPEQSNTVVGQIRYVFGDTFGVYYLIIGLGILLVSIYLAASKYGNIKGDMTVNVNIIGIRDRMLCKA